jgi:hypothetical protein
MKTVFVNDACRGNSRKSTRAEGWVQFGERGRKRALEDVFAEGERL